MPKNENILLDVQLIELEIQRLVEEFPDLAEDADLRADMVEGSTAAYDVLDAILTRVREAESDVAAISTRIDYLDARQSAARSRGAAMRRLALRLMTAGDLKSVKLPEGTLSRVKGRESVAVADESQLPDWAFTVKVDKRVSKKAISDAMDAGIPVPGAYRATGEETLQVR